MKGDEGRWWGGATLIGKNFDPWVCFVCGWHKEITPIQIYIENSTTNKMKIFRKKNSGIIQISAKNIDCGYSLEPPQWGGSNEYSKSTSLSKIMYALVNPSVTI